MFPATEQEYEALFAQGLTVVYVETDTSEPPDSREWHLWSTRTDQLGTRHVWRRIAPIAEALNVE